MLHIGGLYKGALTKDGLSTITQSLANNSEFVKLAIPSQFSTATAFRLEQEVNEARMKNEQLPIEIKGDYKLYGSCVCHICETGNSQQVNAFVWLISIFWCF